MAVGARSSYLRGTCSRDTGTATQLVPHRATMLSFFLPSLSEALYLVQDGIEQRFSHVKVINNQRSCLAPEKRRKKAAPRRIGDHANCDPATSPDLLLLPPRTFIDLLVFGPLCPLSTKSHQTHRIDILATDRHPTLSGSRLQLQHPQGTEVILQSRVHAVFPLLVYATRSPERYRDRPIGRDARTYISQFILPVLPSFQKRGICAEGTSPRMQALKNPRILCEFDGTLRSFPSSPHEGE